MGMSTRQADRKPRESNPKPVPITNYRCMDGNQTVLRHAQDRSQQEVEIALAQALRMVTVRGDRLDSSIATIPYTNR
jgi:hypothetical protein